MSSCMDFKKSQLFSEQQGECQGYIGSSLYDSALFYLHTPLNSTTVHTWGNLCNDAFSVLTERRFMLHLAKPARRMISGKRIWKKVLASWCSCVNAFIYTEHACVCLCNCTCSLFYKYVVLDTAKRICSDFATSINASLI